MSNDDNERDRAAGVNLSLYPEDVALLHQVGRDFGLNSLSGAARFIIRDWVRMKSNQYSLALDDQRP